MCCGILFDFNSVALGESNMIWLYSGTPGSGKSYHATKDVIFNLRHSTGVICNFPVNVKAVRRAKAHFEYVDNGDLTPDYLFRFSKKYHKYGKEGQTLIVIDEAQLIFNCRTFANKDRQSWIKFFSQHRKLGFNVILIAQSDRMLDRQIRCLIETDIRHRKLNNYGMFGFMIGLLFFNASIFYCSEYWACGNSIKVGGKWLIYNPRVSRIYDSYEIFEERETASAGMGGRGAPPSQPEPQSVQNIRKMYINRIVIALKNRAERGKLLS